MGLPASFLGNANSTEARARLVSAVARCAAIFRMHEVVVVDDAVGDGEGGGAEGYAGMFARILEYLETPQYLRSRLIPHHGDLALAGRLPPLDAPHQARKHETPAFREGVVVHHHDDGTNDVDADVGLDAPVRVSCADRQPAVDERVTVRMTATPPSLSTRDAPLDENGTYWGYRVRRCRGVYECLAKDGDKRRYDWIIGTSERGRPLDDGALSPPRLVKKRHAKGKPVRILLLFGGVRGLEAMHTLDGARCASLLQSWGGGGSGGGKDPHIPGSEVARLCDGFVNFCPNQGSRTIRTEEAIFIGLALMRDAAADAATAAQASALRPSKKRRKKEA